jgi:hypothetical protein
VRTMGRDRQLLVFWDPELDGAFRRRLERAFADLNVSAADASVVDIDPDAPPPVRLVLLSARGNATSAKPDLVVQAGPGDFPAAIGALRLEIADIENQTRRWSAFADRLADRLGRPSLAAAPEDLEVRLDEASRRAEEAERARADFELQLNNAERATRHAERELAKTRAQVERLQEDIERLTALSETAAFALADAPEAERNAVANARDHLWRARIAAARADEVAAMYPDALAFPKAHASYSGETRNRLPHGFGVMTFREGAAVTAVYRGAFRDGKRSGHGIATSDGGLVWYGEWEDNEAAGFGVLETPDGRRFEGQVAPERTSGAPMQISGWTWTPMESVAGPHRPVARLLPSPAKTLVDG